MKPRLAGYTVTHFRPPRHPTLYHRQVRSLFDSLHTLSLSTHSHLPTLHQTPLAMFQHRTLRQTSCFTRSEHVSPNILRVKNRRLPLSLFYVRFSVLINRDHDPSKLLFLVYLFVHYFHALRSHLVHFYNCKYSCDVVELYQIYKEIVRNETSTKWYWKIYFYPIFEYCKSVNNNYKIIKINRCYKKINNWYSKFNTI